jgi:hypothetical protein
VPARGTRRASGAWVGEPSLRQRLERPRSALHWKPLSSDQTISRTDGKGQETRLSSVNCFWQLLRRATRGLWGLGHEARGACGLGACGLGACGLGACGASAEPLQHAAMLGRVHYMRTVVGADDHVPCRTAMRAASQVSWCCERWGACMQTPTGICSFCVDSGVLRLTYASCQTHA